MKVPPAVAIAVPLGAAVVEGLVAGPARVRWLWEPELMPPRRHEGDYLGDPAFRRTPAEQARYDRLIDSADVLLGLPDTDPAALRRTAMANPSLAWVHTMAAGGGAQLRAAGLPSERLAALTVTTSAGVHGSALAEFALLGLLAGVKDLPRWQRDQRALRWPERGPVAQLRGRVVLVLGTGGIGSRVAEAVAALGGRPWGLVRDGAVARTGFERVLSLAELPASLGEVDAVVNALPGTARTRHLVDREFLGALRRGCVVVNVGRGSVIDETALASALESGQVGFAALDVFEREPLPADSPLWRSDRVLVSPHTAALDAGEEQRIASLFARNLESWLEGRPLLNVVDKDEFY
ncbi:MAG: D-2-hydroxyacid dehydrogenase [Propionicimonas sp.]